MNASEIQLILIIAGLLMSAYFSGTETVFLSASRVRVEIFLRRKVKHIKRIYEFIEKPESFIVTTLVGTNLSNVIFSTVVVLALKNQVDEFFIVFISSGILLLFAEIIPKSIGQEFSIQLLFPAGLLLKFFRVIFAPINFFLLSITNFFLNRMNLEMKADFQTVFTKKDILKVLSDSVKGGAIQSKESRLIKKIFDLSRIRLKDAMVPRTEIVAVPKDISIKKLNQVFHESGFSRLPVYENSIDDVIGIVYAKDMFTQPKSIDQIIKEAVFFPDSKPAFQLLLELRKKRISIAIVFDEYGGTAGLITVEDLIEELVGEIYDEFDIDHSKMYRMLNDRTIVIDARAEIDEINEKFQLRIPEKETYSTLGGFIIERIQRIPLPGDVVETDTCRMIVEQASKKKVIRVKVVLKKDNYSATTS